MQVPLLVPVVTDRLERQIQGLTASNLSHYVGLVSLALPTSRLGTVLFSAEKEPTSRVIRFVERHDLERHKKSVISKGVSSRL